MCERGEADLWKKELLSHTSVKMSDFTNVKRGLPLLSLVNEISDRALLSAPYSILFFVRSPLFITRPLKI